MFRIFSCAVIVAAFMHSPPAYAQCDVDYKSLEAAGFGNTAGILKQMTPEQCADLMRSVEVLKPQLLDMTQQDIEALRNQAAEMDKRINPAIKVEKIDTKSPPTDIQSIRKGIENYNKQ